MANSFVKTSIGTIQWTWPVGVTGVTVECLGGGGGGGTASGNPATGGGGKGGGYGRSYVYKGPETYLDLVLGGSGGHAEVRQQGTTICRGAGGASGAAQAASSANGTGATTTTGTLPNLGTVGNTYDGGNGGTGDFTASVGGSGAGGGAAGPTGNGGNATGNSAGSAGSGTFLNGVVYQANGSVGAGNSATGISGMSYGGGASGGKANSNTDRAGGTGSAGVIVLTWDDPPTIVIRSVTSASYGPMNTPCVHPFAVLPALGDAYIVAVNASRGGYGNCHILGSVSENYGNTVNLCGGPYPGPAPYWRSCALWLCGLVTATGPGLTVTIPMLAGYTDNASFDVTIIILSGQHGPFQSSQSQVGSGTGVTAAPSPLVSVNAGEYVFVGIMQASTMTSLSPSGGWTVQRGPVAALAGSIATYGTVVVPTTLTPALSWTLGVSAEWIVIEQAFWPYVATLTCLGTLTQTLNNATLAATGSPGLFARIGALTRTLDSATCSADAKLMSTAALTRTLANATVVSASAVVSTALLTRTLDSATLASTAAGVVVQTQPIAMII